MSKTQYCIIGGGTAGWLSALILQEAARRSALDIDITVIESSTIPTIGVGEGTTAVFRGLLLQLGFDEFEFLRETGATIKYGIKHQDWRRLGHSYFGPIDDPLKMVGTPPGVTSSWLNQYCVGAGRAVSEPHLFSQLMRRNRAPFAIRANKTRLPVGPFHHAYHFDQAKVGAYFKQKAKGIGLIDALVVGAETDPDSGDIVSLKLDGAQDIAVDFIIDCTGFKRALIGDVMGARWVSFDDKLPVNRAIPFWLEHPETGEIPTYTLARAMKAGWMWQIPTQDRLGCGYVYSDKFLSPKQAQAEVEAVLGHSIIPRADIPIDAGRLDRAWIGNCLSTGLAQSFFEPLEATSIHGTIVQMMMFTQFHMRAKGADRATHQATYNNNVARQADDFCTFINMHYVSERDDTDFWRYVRTNCISKEVRQLLKVWSDHLPRNDDFAPFPGGLAHVEDQLYYPVLDGLGLLDRALAKQEIGQNPKLRIHARKTTEKLVKEYKRVAAMACGHRSFLESLRE